MGLKYKLYYASSQFYQWPLAFQTGINEVIQRLLFLPRVTHTLGKLLCPWGHPNFAATITSKLLQITETGN